MVSSIKCSWVSSRIKQFGQRIYIWQIVDNYKRKFNSIVISQNTEVEKQMRIGYTDTASVDNSLKYGYNWKVRGGRSLRGPRG